MIIQLTKRTDGALLRFVRDDGSETWQKQEGSHARFFPLHDLMHYAIETELGFRRGFYGLVAEGWDIAETTGKSARGPLPNEALEVEYFVSAFAAERAGGAATTAEGFNQLAATYADARGMPQPRSVTDDELTKVRSRFDELAAKWRGLAPGETLKLAFPPL